MKKNIVMAGLVPAIHVFIGQVVDARAKPGHDGVRLWARDSDLPPDLSLRGAMIPLPPGEIDMPRLFRPILALFVLLAAAPALAGEEAAIRQRLADWTAAFNTGDKQAACDLFSKTLISDYRGQGEAGYETRCALIAKALDDKARRFHYAAEIKEVIVSGDLAVVRLTWTLTIEPGGAKSVEPGLDVFAREPDGQWRIIRYMAFEE